MGAGEGRPERIWPPWKLRKPEEAALIEIGSRSWAPLLAGAPGAYKGALGGRLALANHAVNWVIKFAIEP